MVWIFKGYTIDYVGQILLDDGDDLESYKLLSIQYKRQKNGSLLKNQCSGLATT